MSKPPRTTTAIGLCISLPGLSPLIINGISASAEVNAVIKIGFKRSIEPSRTVCRNGSPSSCKCLYLEINKIPLRVATPKRVIKPIIDGILTTPEVAATANTPPIRARGKVIKTIPESEALLNSPYSNKKITKIAITVVKASVRVALCALSNWPPYSTR